MKVRDLGEQSCVERDLLLVQVNCAPEQRGELRQITEVFRGSIVDVGPRAVIIQLTGPEEKIEAFIDLCRPYGIRELARTGVIAMPRCVQAAQAARHRARHARPRAQADPAGTEEPEQALPPS